MRKAVSRFVLSAVIAAFVLLTAVLGVINAANFTMVAEDADRITEIIASKSGSFHPDEIRGGMTEGGQQDGPDRPGFGGMAFMGPDSPELAATTRFFTVEFTPEGETRVTGFAISAVSREEAVSWAESLRNETTGWTKQSYRYRVWQKDGSTYVTVIDQSRELLPSYRILIISLIGLAAGTAVTFLVLRVTAQKLFRPIEEADRREKRFIADAEAEFKVPLTVISANMELIERQSGGSTEQTRSIQRQVRKMTDTVRRLGRLAILKDEERTEISLSRILQETVEAHASRFEEKGLALSAEIAPNVTICADETAWRTAAREILENALRYGRDEFSLILKNRDGRIRILAENGCSLEDGEYERAFDRFAVLDNGAGPGLGLAQVRETARENDGRVSASVTGGRFLLKIDL